MEQTLKKLFYIQKPHIFLGFLLTKLEIHLFSFSASKIVYN